MLPPDPAQTEFIYFGPSAIHGMGGFARMHLAKGARVVEYRGERISKAESLRRCEAGNWFIFALDDEFDLDGDCEANPARLLNHSCAPNAEAELHDGRVWITALRYIAPGEEITFDYGYTLEEYREHPCHCGAPACAALSWPASGARKSDGRLAAWL